MRTILINLLLCMPVLAADPHGATAVPSASPDEAVAKLVEGNKRFVAGESTFPRSGQDRRCETTAGGQHPYATILSCADSRVPPEYVFDSGIGDLFVIRVAGNVSDTDEIATIEYGVSHLNTPLIVVMGHAKCGAVTAVVEGAPLHGNLAALLDNIQPAANEAKKANPNLSGAPLVAKAVRQNVYQSMEDLIRNSEDVRGLLAQKKVRLIGAIYDIHGGAVEFIGSHPKESELLAATPGKKPPVTPNNHVGDDKSHAPAHTDQQKTFTVPETHTPSHDKPHGAAPASANEPSGEHASTESTPEIEQGMFKRYGPIAAFGIGSIALSAVLLHLVRK